MPCTQLRILVVEDDPAQCQALMNLLRDLGASTVYGANEGHAALRILADADRPVDIMVSDLSMPGMDGMELIRHLSEVGSNVGLILSSALEPTLLASVASMAKAYKVRLLGTVGKPPTAVKLAPLVAPYSASAPSLVAARNRAAFSAEELKQAWEKGEFEAWYQPKVSMVDMRARGMQVVVQWRHPTRGLLGPDVFFPSLRLHGLADDITWLQLRASAAECTRWRAAGLDLDIAITLSFGSLTEAQLALRVLQIVRKEDLDPRHVILGIPEADLDADLPRSLENLARLRVEGFRLSIDEFGSGPMSEEQLSRVAFNELKVCRSFVSGASRDNTARAGLAVALDVARDLRVASVADGIRSVADWNMVRDWGCELAQGSFIAPPMEAAVVPGWMMQLGASGNWWNASAAVAAQPRREAPALTAA